MQRANLIFSRAYPPGALSDFIKTNLDAELDPFRDAPLGSASQSQSARSCYAKSGQRFYRLYRRQQRSIPRLPGRSGLPARQARRRWIWGQELFRPGRGAPNPVEPKLLTIWRNRRQAISNSINSQPRTNCVRQLGELSGGADERRCSSAIRTGKPRSGQFWIRRLHFLPPARLEKPPSAPGLI